MKYGTGTGRGMILAACLLLTSCQQPSAPPPDDPPPEAPLAGDTAATAVVVTAGTLLNQTTVGYQDDYTYSGFTACHGRDRVYSAVVAPAQGFDITVTPESSYNPALILLDQGLNVLACASSGGAGFAETCMIGNGTASPVTFLIVVDSTVADSGGTFDLELLEVP